MTQLKLGMRFGWAYDDDDYATINENFVKYTPASGIEEEGWTMPTEDAKQLCRMMMSWFKYGGVDEFTDEELLKELTNRGYYGKLNHVKILPKSNDKDPEDN